MTAADVDGLGWTPTAIAQIGALRGWTPAAIARLGLTYDRRTRTVGIPVRDATGDLLGVLAYLPNPATRNGRSKVVAPAGVPRELFPPPETLGPDVDRLVLDEGEGDGVAALSAGFASVAIPGTGGWRTEYAARFTGRHWTVYVCFDCDQPGRNTAQAVAGDLIAAGVDARIVDLDPGRDDGYDVTDFLQEHGAAELQRRLEQAEPYTPAPTSEPEPFRIDVYAAKDLYRLPLPHENPELVGPFLRRGRITLLGGTTGHGKTTFGALMLATGALGGDFLGFDVDGGLRVLVLDLEQHLEDIQEQLAAVGLADSELVDYAPIPEGLEIDRDPAQVAELERVISAKPYDIVRVDPFYKLHAADSSEEQQARELVRLTRRWVNRHGFGLLLDTHTRKRIEGRNGFALDDLFGSSLFARDPETILGLQLIADGFSRLHIFKARGRRAGIRTGQTIDLLYDDEELFRRKPDEAERDPRAALLELGADHVWRTLKEWKAKPGKPDADHADDDYVDQRGGIGLGETKVKPALVELQLEGIFEYAEGAAASRGASAKCWRLATAPDAQGTPRHPGQLAGLRGSDDAPAPLPPTPKGWAAGAGQQPLGCPEAAGQSERDDLPDEAEVERLAELARRETGDS